MAVVTLAAAQPRRPASRPLKPPAKDAAAPTDTASAGDAGLATGPTEPTPIPDIGDGGAKPSPLNPTAPEMPGSSTVDAGVPVDYDRILADIAALRARIAAVSDSLYQSRVAIAVENDSSHGKIARLSVSLDDGVVYTAPPTFAASDMTTLYDHAVAPGKHAVTIDVDRKDDRDESFRNSQRSRFTVDVPRDQKVSVEIRIDDDSSMGGDYPSDHSGKYDLRFRVKAVAKPSK
jgi:hypothetical protein